MPTTRPEPSSTATVDVPAIEADVARALTHASEPWEYTDLAEIREQLLGHVQALVPATEEAAGQLHPHSVTRHTLAVRLESARAQMSQPTDPDAARALHQVRQLAITCRLLLAEHKRRQQR